MTGVDHRILRLNAVRQGTWKKQQLTFGNGIVARERIIDVDDAARLVVWSVFGAPFTHHNASA